MPHTPHLQPSSTAQDCSSSANDSDQTSTQQRPVRLARNAYSISRRSSPTSRLGAAALGVGTFLGLIQGAGAAPVVLPAVQNSGVAANDDPQSGLSSALHKIEGAVEGAAGYAKEIVEYIFDSAPGGRVPQPPNYTSEELTTLASQGTGWLEAADSGRHPSRRRTTVANTTPSTPATLDPEGYESAGIKQFSKASPLYVICENNGTGNQLTVEWLLNGEKGKEVRSCASYDKRILIVPAGATSINISSQNANSVSGYSGTITKLPVTKNDGHFFAIIWKNNDREKLPMPKTKSGFLDGFEKLTKILIRTHETYFSDIEAGGEVNKLVESISKTSGYDPEWGLRKRVWDNSNEALAAVRPVVPQVPNTKKWSDNNLPSQFFDKQVRRV